MEQKFQLVASKRATAQQLYRALLEKYPKQPLPLRAFSRFKEEVRSRFIRISHPCGAACLVAGEETHGVPGVRAAQPGSPSPLCEPPPRQRQVCLSSREAAILSDRADQLEAAFAAQIAAQEAEDKAAGRRGGRKGSGDGASSRETSDPDAGTLSPDGAGGFEALCGGQPPGWGQAQLALLPGPPPLLPVRLPAGDKASWGSGREALPAYHHDSHGGGLGGGMRSASPAASVRPATGFDMNLAEISGASGMLIRVDERPSVESQQLLALPQQDSLPWPPVATEPSPPPSPARALRGEGVSPPWPPLRLPPRSTDPGTYRPKAAAVGCSSSLREAAPSRRASCAGSDRHTDYGSSLPPPSAAAQGSPMAAAARAGSDAPAAGSPGRANGDGASVRPWSSRPPAVAVAPELTNNPTFAPTEADSPAAAAGAVGRDHGDPASSLAAWLHRGDATIPGALSDEDDHEAARAACLRHPGDGGGGSQPAAAGRLMRDAPPANISRSSRSWHDDLPSRADDLSALYRLGSTEKPGQQAAAGTGERGAGAGAADQHVAAGAAAEAVTEQV